MNTNLSSKRVDERQILHECEPEKHLRWASNFGLTHIIFLDSHISALWMVSKDKASRRCLKWSGRWPKVNCSYGVPNSNPVARKVSHLLQFCYCFSSQCEKATGFEFGYAITALYFNKVLYLMRAKHCWFFYPYAATTLLKNWYLDIMNFCWKHQP